MAVAPKQQWWQFCLVDACVELTVSMSLCIVMYAAALERSPV